MKSHESVAFLAARLNDPPTTIDDPRRGKWAVTFPVSDGRRSS